MPLVSMSVTIRAGESLSDAFGVGAGSMFRIEMPDEWTPANLTFQLAKHEAPEDFREAYSVMLGFFGDLMVPVRPGAIAVLGQTTFGREGYIKLRSGTADDPVAQEADRTFTVVIKPDEESSPDEIGEPPAPLSAAMTDGETVCTINFDAALNDTSLPAPAAFDVIVKGVKKPVVGVTVTGSQCRLTMDARYSAGPITASYTKPASGAVLKGTDGDAVASFFSLSVLLP